MKTFTISTAILAALACVLRAQSFTITAPGYSGQQLVTSSPGYVVSAVATDGAGSLYYVESDANFVGSRPTRLWTLPFTATTHGSPTLLYSFGANLSGSFLRYRAGQLFLGENTTGGLYAIGPALRGVDFLGTVPNNFDAAFSGSQLYVSNNPGYNGNRVTRYSLVPDGGGGLQLSAGVEVLSAGTQSSGPIEFTNAGDLIYGSSSANIYRYSAAEVAAGGLTLDAAHERVTTDANSYFASLGDGRVLRDSYLTSEARMIDISTGVTTVIGNCGASDSLGDLDGLGGMFVMSITDYSAGSSAVFLLVPEPSTTAMCAVCAFLVLARGRRSGSGNMPATAETRRRT